MQRSASCREKAVQQGGPDVSWSASARADRRSHADAYPFEDPVTYACRSTTRCSSVARRYENAVDGTIAVVGDDQAEDRVR